MIYTIPFLENQEVLDMLNDSKGVVAHICEDFPKNDEVFVAAFGLEFRSRSFELRIFRESSSDCRLRCVLIYFSGLVPMTLTSVLYCMVDESLKISRLRRILSKAIDLRIEE